MDNQQNMETRDMSDALSGEVRDALMHIRPDTHRFEINSWNCVRAELLRLAALERRLLALDKATPVSPAVTDHAYCSGWNTCRKIVLGAIPEPPR